MLHRADLLVSFEILVDINCHVIGGFSEIKEDFSASA